MGRGGAHLSKTRADENFSAENRNAPYFLSEETSLENSSPAPSYTPVRGDGVFHAALNHQEVDAIFEYSIRVIRVYSQN